MAEKFVLYYAQSLENFNAILKLLFETEFSVAPVRLTRPMSLTKIHTSKHEINLPAW